MTEFINIGKIISTHGLKGELKVLSNFSQKEKVFIRNFKIYINGTSYNILSWRKHQQYDLITFEEINDIAKAINFKQKNIYLKRSDLNLKDNDYLREDLVQMQVCNEETLLGVVDKIINNNNYILLDIKTKKHFYIPYNEHFISKIDIENNKIFVKNTEGLY